MNLKGFIAPEIGNLQHLKTLDLSSNALTGRLPLKLPNSLESIRLQGNHLSGNIPEEYGQLSNLVNLFLHENKLEAIIPASIGKLSKLENLYLNSNTFNGPIPDSLGDIPGLIVLSLHHAGQLSGSIPSSLGNLKTLRELYLDGNVLSGNIPTSFGELTNLVYLHMDGNLLSGSIPVSFSNLARLEELWLRDNNLVGRIPLLSGLKKLYVSNNQLDAIDSVKSWANYNPVNFVLEPQRENGGGTSYVFVALLVGTFIAALVIAAFVYLRYKHAKANRDASVDLSRMSRLTALSDTYIDGSQSSKSTPIMLSEQKLTPTFRGNTSYPPLPFPDLPESIVMGGTPSDQRFSINSQLPSYPKSIFSSYVEFVNSTTDNEHISDFFKDSSMPDRIVYISKGGASLDFFVDLVNYFFYPTDVYYTAKASFTPSEDDELDIRVGDDIMALQHTYDGWCVGYNRRTKDEGSFPLVITTPRFPTKLWLYHVDSLFEGDRKRRRLIESVENAYPLFIEFTFVEQVDIDYLCERVTQLATSGKSVMTMVKGDDAFVAQIGELFNE